MEHKGTGADVGDGARVITHPGPRSHPNELENTMSTTPRRKGATDAGAYRLNIRVSQEAARRLGIHAVMTGITPGRLVEQLISEHLKSYRVQTVVSRTTNGHSPDSASQGDGVSLAEATAA